MYTAKYSQLCRCISDVPFTYSVEFLKCDWPPNSYWQDINTVKQLIIGDDIFGEIGEFKKFSKLVVAK